MFSEGLSITRPTMYISLLGLGVNIVSNYVLMFGNFGFPAMGAVGAGWATSMVYCVMFYAMLAFCLKASILKTTADLLFSDNLRGCSARNFENWNPQWIWYSS
ncbi:MAG: polysaccharide biosynthesis C-terminal domain-containing protein [SAR324 cluster bacterium]|nr:polysaccharide biosynthesis C-terminal domain-containing protein [SAR324 cluster bacterium]